MEALSWIRGILTLANIWIIKQLLPHESYETMEWISIYQIEDKVYVRVQVKTYHYRY